jgi:hypothetical protein
MLQRLRAHRLFGKPTRCAYWDWHGGSTAAAWIVVAVVTVNAIKGDDRHLTDLPASDRRR